MIFYSLFLIFSVYKFFKNDFEALTTLFLVSTLLNTYNLQLAGFIFKIEHILFILLSFSIFMIHSFKNNSFTIAIDSKILFVFYIFLSALLVRILYPDMLVWPTGLYALGTNVANLSGHLIPLKENSNLIKQSLFVIYPILFFIFASKLDDIILLKSLKYYIFAIFIISLLNILVYLAIFISPNLITFLDPFIGNIFGDSFNYRYGTSKNISDQIRVSFFIGEPSFMNIYLIPIIIFIFLNNFFDKKIFFFIFVVLIINILLSRSTSGFLSLILIMGMISLFKFKHIFNLSKVLLSIILISILLLFFYETISSYYSYTKLKFISPSSSIWPRLWSVNHSFEMLSKSPILGSGIGTSIATSGFIVLITSFGFIGTLIFFHLISLKKIIKSIFKIKDKSFFALTFTILTILISNLISGDITTIISPIIFLFVILHNRKYLDLSR